MVRPLLGSNRAGLGLEQRGGEVQVQLWVHLWQATHLGRGASSLPVEQGEVGLCGPDIRRPGVALSDSGARTGRRC